MRIVLVAVLVVAVALAAASSTGAGQETSFVAQLAGRQEVPPVATNAQGRAVFQLNGSGTALTYRLTVSNITNVTMAHIHLGARGQNGPVVVTLFPGPTMTGRRDGTLAAGTITSASLSGPLAGQQLRALIRRMRDGGAYVNVHTTAHPGGEIRGQIEVTAH